jgi:hypothetical protein
MDKPMKQSNMEKIFAYLKEIQGMAHPSIIHEFHPSMFTKQLTAHLYDMQNLSEKVIFLLENETNQQSKKELK